VPLNPDRAAHDTADRRHAPVVRHRRRGRVQSLFDEAARRTALHRSARLSDETGAQVWFKREDLQVGRSYKVRGAYNTIGQLEDATAGVVCASAGNHGQGVAYACRARGIRGRVFVPGTTPRQKRDRITALGGGMVELVVVGDTYDDSAAAARPWR